MMAKLLKYLLLIWSLGCCFIWSVNCAVLVADFTMSKMVELNGRRPYCKVHTDRGDIQRMLLAADTKRIRSVPTDSVVALEEVCSEVDSLNGELQGGLGFIYPGTKWCGPGSIATSEDDLGRYIEEDKCCRDHDNCPDILSPGECKRGLCNKGSFTRSHCDCDAKFRACLQNLNTEIANTLGAVFFNVIQVTCISERSPCSILQRHNKTCNHSYKYFPSGLYLPSAEFSQEFNEISASPPLIDKEGGDADKKPKQSRSLDASSSENLIENTTRRLSDRESEAKSELLNKIRFQSLGLVVKNLFNDIIVRPVMFALKFARTTREVFETAMPQFVDERSS